MSTTVEPTRAIPTPEAAPIADLAPAVDRLYRLSIEQYHRLAEAGVLIPADRVELIEGLLVQKMTKHERHIGTTRLIQRALERVLGEGFYVAKEDPILLARSEPEPDIAVLRGRMEDYLNHKPGSAEIAMIVEVAEASYLDDRRKLAIYADARIPVYWIANLNADRIEVYSDPTGPDTAPEYRSRREYTLGESIPLIIDGRVLAQFAVGDLIVPTPR